MLSSDPHIGTMVCMCASAHTRNQQLYNMGTQKPFFLPLLSKQYRITIVFRDLDYTQYCRQSEITKETGGYAQEPHFLQWAGPSANRVLKTVSFTYQGTTEWVMRENRAWEGIGEEGSKRAKGYKDMNVAKTVVRGLWAVGGGGGGVRQVRGRRLY